MKKEELVKKLRDAYKKLENVEDKYEVFEQVSLGRGTGNYKFVFIAKKKKKRGLFGAIANIAKKVYWYGASGVAFGIMDEIAQRRMQESLNLSPIQREITGSELAMIFKRWCETIPQGYIETIGNNLSLPSEDKWISASIKPDKEIRITMEFVKLRTPEVAPSQPGEAQPEAAPQPVPQVQPKVVPIPTHIPTTVPVQIPTVDFSQLYVKGSLTSTGEGTSFAIRNLFKPTKVVAPIIVKIDGKEISAEKIRIISNVGEKANKDIGPNSPLPVGYGETLLIKIDGLRLSKGMHKIDVTVSVEEMGNILISNVDNIQ